jgi:hypothetical protein
MGTTHLYQILTGPSFALQCCCCHSQAIGHVQEVIWMTTIMLSWCSLVASDTAIQGGATIYLYLRVGCIPLFLWAKLASY